MGFLSTSKLSSTARSAPAAKPHHDNQHHQNQKPATEAELLELMERMRGTFADEDIVDQQLRRSGEEAITYAQLQRCGSGAWL